MSIDQTTCSTASPYHPSVRYSDSHPHPSIHLSVSFAFRNKDLLPGYDGSAKGRGWQATQFCETQLAQHILAGHTICVAALKSDHRQKTNFASAQIICLDLDHGPSVEVLRQDSFIATYASLVYATPSSTPDRPRARVLFILDTAITDADIYRQFVHRLQHYFVRAGLEVDLACKDAVRMFHGSENAEHVLFEDKRLPLAFLEQLPDPLRKRQASKRQRKSPATSGTQRTPSGEQNELVERVRSALASIPTKLEYEEWLSLLMAVHSAFPDQLGVQLIEEWSPGYPGEVEYKFASFDTPVANPITINTLWHFALNYGWIPPSPLPTVVPDHTINSRYVSESGLQLQGAMLLKSAMGTGKTEFIKRAIEDMERQLNRPIRVLAATHRVTLTEQLCERLGFENYQSIPSGQLHRPAKIVSTINSLFKLTRNGSPLPLYDLVIIDEVEQVLAHLVGDTFKGSAGVTANNILRTLIQRATAVLAIDAYAAQTSLRYLKQLREDVTFVENRYQPNLGNMYLIPSRDEILTLLRHTVRQATRPIIVACDRKETAKAIARVLDPLCEGNLRVIHGDNSHHAVSRDLLKNIDTDLQALTLLIYSPSIGSGVDIQAEVDCVFALFEGNELSADECLQMIGRARKADTFYVYILQSQQQRETEKTALYQHHLANLKRTGLECDFDPEGNAVTTPRQEAYLDLYAEVSARRYRSINHRYLDFVQLAAPNFTLSRPEFNLSGVQAHVKEAAKLQKEEEQQLLLIQPAINEERYRQHRENGTCSVEIDAGYRRWQIETFYGRAISNELLAEWKHGKGERRLDQFIALHRPHAELIALDRQEEVTGIPWHRRSHYAVRQRVLKELLASVFGAHLHTDEIPKQELDALLGDRFSALVRQNENIIYGILGRRRSQQNSPMNLLRHCLQLIGLDLKEHRRGHKRDRISYSVSASRLETMRSYASARVTSHGVQLDFSDTYLV